MLKIGDFDRWNAHFGTVLNDQGFPRADRDTTISLVEIPLELQKVARRLPARAVFSGRTAAWLHGLDFAPCDPIEVSLPMNSQTSHLARVALRRSDFGEDEVSSVHALRVTSRVRTVADVARHVDVVEATVILDTALHRRIVGKGQLQAWIDSHPGFRGIGVQRRALELAEYRAESPMESRLRLLFIRAGLPRPSLQVPLYDSRGLFLARPDLYYPIHRLAIEYDGAIHRHSLAADNRRQNRLLEAGYRLLRFTAADVLSTPAETVRIVSRALATPPRSLTPGSIW